MGTQFNVSYNHGGVNKISTIKKTIAFIWLGNNQDMSLLNSKILSIVSVKISFFRRDVILFRGQMSSLPQISNNAPTNGGTFQNTVAFFSSQITSWRKILSENPSAVQKISLGMFTEVCN